MYNANVPFHFLYTISLKQRVLMKHEKTVKGCCVFQLLFSIPQAGWIIALIILFTVHWIHFLLTTAINQNYMKYAEQNSSPYHKPESKESKKRTRHVVLNGKKTERV